MFMFHFSKVKGFSTMFPKTAIKSTSKHFQNMIRIAYVKEALRMKLNNLPENGVNNWVQC